MSVHDETTTLNPSNSAEAQGQRAGLRHRPPELLILVPAMLAAAWQAYGQYRGFGVYWSSADEFDYFFSSPLPFGLLLLAYGLFFLLPWARWGALAVLTGFAVYVVNTVLSILKSYLDYDGLTWAQAARSPAFPTAVWQFAGIAAVFLVLFWMLTNRRVKAAFHSPLPEGPRIGVVIGGLVTALSLVAMLLGGFAFVFHEPFFALGQIFIPAALCLIIGRGIRRLETWTRLGGLAALPLLLYSLINFSLTIVYIGINKDAEVVLLLLSCAYAFGYSVYMLHRSYGSGMERRHKHDQITPQFKRQSRDANGQGQDAMR